MHLRSEPFLLRPVGKDYLWGGNRLNDDFSKNINMHPLAETWECSTHPDGISIISSGKYAGRDLKSLLYEHPEYLGTHNQQLKELPILIKFIDAKKDLSVQVHPSDEYAFQHEHGQKGKTEMWYVMDADQEAKIIYGFHHDVSKERLRQSLKEGTIERHLQKVSVHPDDVFLIQSGTVHAIGAGTLIAEIQESSNLTYRMYDYDRTDKNGNKRELHIEKALDVCDTKQAKEPRQPIRIMHYQNGMASEFLCRCRYFQVERVLINTERIRTLAKIQTDTTSFQVLLCVKGCGVITGEEDLMFFKGDCIFIPADSAPVLIHGCATMLKVHC